MIFPTMTGQTQDGQSITLPHGLKGEYSLFVIAFQQRQRTQVDVWMSHLRPLCAHYDDLGCYELPIIQTLPGVQIDFADSWTRRNADDPEARRSTIPLYVDINDFNRALDIPTVSTTYAMLIDREGEVLWRVQGGYEPLKMRMLLRTVKRVCRKRQPAFASR